MGMQGFNAASMEAMLLPMLATIVTMSLCVIFILLFGRIVMGIFCRKLAGRKGYEGYFWTGFFFGTIGLLYVIGLPDLNLRKDMRAVLKRLVSVNERVAAMENKGQF